MLTASMLIFGTIGVFRRMIPMDSALIAFFRGAVGCAFIWLFSRLKGKKTRDRTDRKTLVKLIVSGAVIGVNWLLLFEAFNHTSVSVATLCYYMEPTIVILASVVLFREKLTVKKAACALAALGGMVLVSGVTESGLPTGSDRKGILLGLGAACLYATVVLLNKSVRGVDPYFKTTVQLGAAGAVMLPFLLATGGFTGCEWSLKTVGLLLLTGVLHTGVSYALYFGSMDGLKTQTVALFSYLDPVTALLLSALVLRESLSWPGLLGAALILGSAALGELEKR
ncbi:MAG: DMT family transporter [Clostridia bacterium]|nr:DMT family transporter [Clostridia bacterium]